MCFTFMRIKWTKRKVFWANTFFPSISLEWKRKEKKNIPNRPNFCLYNSNNRIHMQTWHFFLSTTCCWWYNRNNNNKKERESTKNTSSINLFARIFASNIEIDNSIWKLNEIRNKKRINKIFRIYTMWVIYSRHFLPSKYTAYLLLSKWEIERKLCAFIYV